MRAVCVCVCVCVCMCCVCVPDYLMNKYYILYTSVQVKLQQCIGERTVLLHGRSLSSTGNTAHRSSNSSVESAIVQDYTGNSHVIRILTQLTNDVSQA